MCIHQGSESGQAVSGNEGIWNRKEKYLYGPDFRKKLLQTGISEDAIETEKGRFAGNQKH